MPDIQIITYRLKCLYVQFKEFHQKAISLWHSFHRLSQLKTERQTRIIYGILNCKVDYLLRTDALMFRDANFLFRDKKLINEVYKPLDCFKLLKHGNHPDCIHHFAQSCRNSSVVAIKENRLRMSQIEKLLDSDENVYIIHYTRDPRGIASSAPYSALAKHGARATPKEIEQSIKLCKNMFDDTKIFQKLRKKYPARLMHVKYEDLGVHPLDTSQSVYNLFGQALPAEVWQWLEGNTEQDGKDRNRDTWGTKRNSSDVVFKWKTKLSTDIQASIYNISACAKVMKELGYVS